MAKKHANSAVQSKTTFTVQKRDAPGTLRHPLVHDAVVGKRRRWAAWQDWVSVGLGIYFALAPLWTPSAPVGLFMTLGLLVVAVSVWAGSTASSTLAEFMKMVLGAVIIVSAFFNAHTEERTAIMTSWFVGAALIVLSLLASHRNRTGRSATNATQRT
ncbi:SPW repeat domain-containing protein [Enteractinococcus fodinae]